MPKNLLNVLAAFAAAFITGMGDARADAVLDSNYPAWPVAWSNKYGDFGYSTASPCFYRTSDPYVSYSTASSTYAAAARGESIGGPGNCPSSPISEFQISAKIIGNGTAAGKIIAGSLTIRADAEGDAAAGIAGGEVLAIGELLDAAALSDSLQDTFFLFRYVYLHPTMSYLGDFGQYDVPTGGTWGWESSGTYQPWGVDVPYHRDVLTFGVLHSMFRIPEPSSALLVASGLAIGLSLRTRRREINAAGASQKTKRQVG